MGTVASREIKKELVYFLRNQDILSISTRGVTTVTDTGTFSSDPTFTPSTNPTLLKNVRSVTVGGSGLSYGEDYTINQTTGVITFTSAQTGAYTIIYDYGTTDRIFPDWPQGNLNLNDFPRIGFDFISSVATETEIGAAGSFTDYNLSIIAYDNNSDNVDTMIDDIRAAIIANKKTFYYFPFIRLTSAGPMIRSPFGKDKTRQRNQDARVRFVYEDNS